MNDIFSMALIEYFFVFVHAVYLRDDHITLIVNASSDPQREKDVPFDNVEKVFEKQDETDLNSCSATERPAPPRNIPLLSARAREVFCCIKRFVCSIISSTNRDLWRQGFQ